MNDFTFDVEKIREAFASGFIDENEFRDCLIFFGLNWFEVEREISLALEERYSLEDHIDHGVHA